MMFEDRRIEGQEMKPYKGYGIDKSWEMVGNKRVPNSVRYMVIDEEDDWIGDVYKTLDEAKAYIDSLVGKEVKASTRVVKASINRPYDIVPHNTMTANRLAELENLGLSEHSILQGFIDYLSEDDIAEVLDNLKSELDFEED